MRRILRQVRGAVGNAFVWGAAWFATTFGVLSAFVLTGFDGGSVVGLWSMILLMAGQSGLSGFVTGLLFSAYLRLTQADRSIMEVSVGRSAIAGASVASIFPLGTSLIWIATAGAALALSTETLVVLAAFGVVPPMIMGALTAGGSIYAAKQGELHQIEQDQRESFGLPKR